MYTLDIEELVTVLRALHFYEDKLTNMADDHRNPYEWDQVIWLRSQLSGKLKFEAKIV
jgi:hypothetical protein